MVKKELYKDRRWTDIPKAAVVGHLEQTEERKESKKKLRNHLKKIGIIKE